MGPVDAGNLLVEPQLAVPGDQAVTGDFLGMAGIVHADAQKLAGPLQRGEQAHRRDRMGNPGCLAQARHLFQRGAATGDDRLHRRECGGQVDYARAVLVQHPDPRPRASIETAQLHRPRPVRR